MPCTDNLIETGNTSLPGSTFSCSPFRFLPPPHPTFISISSHEKMASSDNKSQTKYNELIHYHQHRSSSSSGRQFIQGESEKTVGSEVFNKGNHKRCVFNIEI